ncbi:DUF3304 domain-containing protein [Ectopseudomonas guguanensis]|uniref:DUF3304 domain-containing protein n=1 Tax=Ectopseudomonas guguanensis TaxID=1198456 RepID=UPI0012D6B6D9|nr:MULTISPECIES: DUF3304 domain-containing protein [Pseudomonas]MDR8016676.1 DUF3304 domain-containing protein [Pseudomonas guguanensis]MPT19327.1 DUF3304 domain-containing protein [Pseudomonas sp.]WJH54678.1 DUF3304 domain-containing protein [Pseudomonas guguanensis]
MNKLGILLVLSLLILGGCNSRPERLGAPIEGYNYTSAAINRFSVNGDGGSNVGPYSGGGQTCCASLPIKWQSGLTVIVEWEKDPNVGAYRYWSEPMFSDAWRKRMAAHKAKYTSHRTVVEVAPYEALGVVTVHFLPCNQVKVAAGTTRPRLQNHPYKYPLRMEEPSQC